MRVHVIAEIGINHAGAVASAIDHMRVAKAAGCDSVKFQKRDLALAIPPSMRDQPRPTPWGTLRYEEYKQRIEFGGDEFAAISAAARELEIEWSSSAFDPPSAAFLADVGVPWIKIPSACITDIDTVRAAADTSLPVIMSTGGSTWAEIGAAVGEHERRSSARLTLMHCCSTYPHPPEAARLSVLTELRQRFGHPVGWSGHESPDVIGVTLAAVGLGATVVERHVCLSRHQWGSDIKASLEPAELARLVTEIRAAEAAMSSGSERPVDAAERAKVETMRRTTWTK